MTGFCVDDQENFKLHVYVLCAGAHEARVVVDPPELELLALVKAASQRDWGAKFWKSRKCFITTDFRNTLFYP